MPPVVIAMAMAAAILLPIVIFIVVISIATVKRGEIAMHGEVHAPAVPAAAVKAGAAVMPGALSFRWMTLPGPPLPHRCWRP